MREREFWELLEEVFGRSYGRSLARDQRMPQLANMTVLEALDAGEEPRVIWNVLCDQMEIPDSKRWGRERAAAARCVVGSMLWRWAVDFIGWVEERYSPACRCANSNKCSLVRL